MGHRSSEPDAPPAAKKGGHICQACHKHHRSASGQLCMSQWCPPVCLQFSLQAKSLGVSHYLSLNQGGLLCMYMICSNAALHVMLPFNPSSVKRFASVVLELMG